MSQSLERDSPCKVNLLLNILGRRPDGFHELETVFHPVHYCDRLLFSRGGGGVELTCSDARLPVDSTNLIHRAATGFLQEAGIRDGVRIQLEKKIPLAAGLGGGSGNAAVTLLGLNELFGKPLTADKLHALASKLGSDVPFFLQDKPALATGRGEIIQSLEAFPAMRGMVLLLVQPGFGISTAWAYKNLARFPDALIGQPGRARRLVELLQKPDLAAAGKDFYNSLEAPALEKYPLLALFQEFFRANGAVATLMSGSGSTTFALVPQKSNGEVIMELLRSKFGESTWTAIVPV
jgi:4-diphosphocytidyl-2-C-methyl-D-erythritol kinase